MKVGTFFVRVWRFGSILGVAISLISCYIAYPAEVAVLFNEIGQATKYIDRETIFYASVALFLINNTLINSIARLFPKLPNDRLPFAPIWIAHRDQLNEVMLNWFYALMAAINTILALALFVLSMLNRSDIQNDSLNYSWLLPLSTAIIAIVFISLPVRILLMKPDAEEVLS